MAWLVFSVAGYFLNAAASTIDKVLLERRVPHPLTYTVYSGVLSIGVAVLIPFFGLQLLSGPMTALAFASGAAFVGALYFFYKAVRLWEISRVAIIVGSFSTLATLVASALLFGENFGVRETWAIALLLAAGVLLVFERSDRIIFRSDIALFGAAAAILFVFSIASLKLIFTATTFANGFIWTRFGSFLFAAGLLAIPAIRSSVARTHGAVRKSSLAWVVINKVVGGAAFISIAYAVMLGSPTLVSALKSSEYGFIFLFATALSLFSPRVLAESLHPHAIAQKVVGIALVVAGVFILYA